MKALLAVTALGLASCGHLSQVSPDSTAIASATGRESATVGAELARKTTPRPPDDEVKVAPVEVGGQKLQKVDLYVSLLDPQDKRKLALYLLKSDQWTLVKTEHISDTLKHYVFQRTVSDKPSLPEISPLTPNPRETEKSLTP